MSLFKAAVLKIQRGQALVKPLKAGPLTARICLEDKNIDEFNPGKDIIGHVEVLYNQEFLFSGIKLTVEGLVHIKYREDKYAFDRKSSIWTESIYLIGAFGQKKIRSKAGNEESYDFRFQIPTDLPGSYKSEFGSITYHLYVQLDYGEKMTKRANKIITLKGQLELDPDDPSTADAVEIEERDHKAVKRVAHNKVSTDGQLRFLFRIEHGGFLAGEKIPFLLDLENPRKAYKITLLKVILVQEVTYYGGKIPKKVTTKLGSTSQEKSNESSNQLIYFDLTDQQKQDQWESTIEIPRGIFPTTKGTEINVQYYLKVFVITKTVKLIGQCPVIIGTMREGLTLEEIEEASEHYGNASVKDPENTVNEDSN